MFRTTVFLAMTMVLGASLTGCGLAETGMAGAAAGASQVQQAQEAKRTEERVKQQVDAAMQVDAARRNSADKEAQ
jgi:cytochrome c biogenesis protein ResB